jgi:hypothetical protein
MDDYKLCVECDRNGTTRIAYYRTIAARSIYDSNKNKICLCEDCLKEKSYDQISKAEIIYKYAKDPKRFITVKKFHGGKHTR